MEYTQYAQIFTTYKAAGIFMLCKKSEKCEKHIRRYKVLYQTYSITHASHVAQYTFTLQ